VYTLNKLKEFPMKNTIRPLTLQKLTGEISKDYHGFWKNAIITIYVNYN
jgi:hypothetical protein